MTNVTIVGRLTRDPERVTTANGKEFVRFDIASNTFRGEEKLVSFFSCIAFGNTAQRAEKYFTKGKPVVVSGELVLRPYQTKDGRTGTSADVSVDRVDFVPGVKEEKKEEPAKGWEPVAKSANDWELPF